MDIMMPTLEQQPSPAPWLVRAKRIDLSRYVADVLAQWPGATVDEVVRQLVEHHRVQASGIIVSMLLSKWKAHAVSENDPRSRRVKPSTSRPAMVALQFPEWAVGI